MTSTARPLPPMPPALPLVGHAPRVMRDVLGFMQGVTREYGDVVRVRLGPREVWVIGHPADIETLHVQTGRMFDKGLWRNWLLSRLLGRGLLVSEGDFWLRQRRLEQPAFHSTRIQGYLGVMQDLTRDLVTQWSAGGVRDVSADLSSMTMKIVMRSVMGVPAGSDRVQAISASLDSALRGFQRDLGNPLPRWVPTPARRQAAAGIRGIDRVMSEIIAESRAQGPQDQDDLLQMLVSARDDDGSGMTDAQLLDEVKNILLAGHDTTASTLSFALFLLSGHPQQEARLLAELRDVLAGGLPDLTQLRQLPYLDAVVKETLRLYPAAWSTQREARQEVQVGGFAAPAGTLFWINHWVTHRDARFFDAPEAFRPERWLDGTLERNLPKFAYFPFGGGGRICIGREFARLEAATALSQLVQRFMFESVGPLVLEPAVSLRPHEGLQMRVTPRA